MIPPLDMTPKYWRFEQSGTLAPVMEKYIREELLTEDELKILRRYFIQWILAPVWDTNPDADAEGTRELYRLRRDACLILTQADADRWIRAAIEFGMDPL